MPEPPPNPALPESVQKFKADDWTPPGHDPGKWHPPEIALRKFAHRQAAEQRRIFPPWPRCARENWMCLCVALLEDEWLLSELSVAEADEAIFFLSINFPYAAPEWADGSEPSTLVSRFVEACVELYGSGRAFHPEGSSKWMLWDNLRLSYTDEPATGPLQDLLLEAMLRVLELDDRDAKKAALHGLGHHKDHRARPAIQALIDSTDDEELRDYARDAYEFSVL